MGGQAMLARGNGMRPASAHQSAKCVVCGNYFSASTYEINRGRARTCSPSCAGKAQALRHWPGPTVQLRTLGPGTRFRIETTEGTVVRQHRKMAETVVRFRRYGDKTTVRSAWSNQTWVRVQ